MFKFRLPMQITKQKVKQNKRKKDARKRDYIFLPDASDRKKIGNKKNRNVGITHLPIQ